MGEVGEDGGGPKREFWMLVGREIKRIFFEGEDGYCTLKHDAISLMVRTTCYDYTLYINFNFIFIG